MKYINIVIFLLLSIVFLLFFSQIKFSTNFLELFFSPKTVELFDTASKLGLSQNKLISKKGFNDKSLDELYKIAKELKEFPEISKVTISKLPSQKMKNYYKDNYYLLADFNNTKISKEYIREKLQIQYTEMQNSFFYLPLDTNDPLELFNIEFNLEDRYLKLKNYGYMLSAKTTIDTASASQSKKLYDKLNLLISEYDDIKIYASFFFLVENSAYIQNDTQIIIALASVLLLLLYFFMLKNYKLLLNTILVIGSSSISAILLSNLVFGEINILVLAFGISITTVSIDYMFHYYFHGYFSHKGFIKQKSVFFGFITTIGVFIIFSFIDIKLFSFLAFFSVISLVSAYMLFSSVFGYLEIYPPKLQNIKPIKKFNPIYFLLFSFLLLIYSYQNLKFDNNLRNLDYKNEKLLKLAKEFNKSLEVSRYKGVLLEAKSKELLLQKYEKISLIYPNMLGIGEFIYSFKKCKEKLKSLKEYNFLEIKKIIKAESKKIGFNDAFKNTYIGVKNIKCNMKRIDEMVFKIIKDKNIFYTMVLLPKNEPILNLDEMQEVDLVKRLSQDMEQSKKTITNFMIISLLFIFLMLFIISGLNILYPLVFVLFPFSIVLFFISLFGTINIMHLFALIILIAISIDYGIYMNNTKNMQQTKMAIKYALLSTMAGFGVLIFSDTTALNSIGFVISIGVGAIFILIKGSFR